MSTVAFFATGRAGRGGMVGTAFLAPSVFEGGKEGTSDVDDDAAGAERGGRGGGFEGGGLDGDGTSTKSPVATGVISALDVGRPSFRKSEDDGTGGGGARFLGS